MHAHRERLEWGWVWAWNEAMKDVFARCLKKIAVQVCIVIIGHPCLLSLCIHISCFYSCMQGIWFVMLIGVYFRKLKINYDTHDFILESGTIANSSCSCLYTYNENITYFVHVYLRTCICTCQCPVLCTCLYMYMEIYMTMSSPALFSCPCSY